jgi:hypothetical protein
VERFDLRAKKPKLARINLQPREARDFILANRAALLGSVLDADMPALMEPSPVSEPVVVNVLVATDSTPVEPLGAPLSDAKPLITRLLAPKQLADEEPNDTDSAGQDRKALVPAGVGGRQPADDASRTSRAATTTLKPLGAGARTAPPTPLALKNLTGDDSQRDDRRREAAVLDQTAENGGGSDGGIDTDHELARPPWYRRMLGGRQRGRR